ncbi:MAG: response regulator [Candidatus Omnitrophica bacterium]|nr:response regulator [Candidatus Omnitrophota bacterium]
MKKRILICDDEEGIRESLNLILEDDYKISFANNGEEALEYLKKESTDLVILDIKMPKLDGLKTLKEIRKALPQQKVIIATGYQSIETATESSQLGAADYITKPFETEKILKTVSTIIHG